MLIRQCEIIVGLEDYQYTTQTFIFSLFNRNQLHFGLAVSKTNTSPISTCIIELLVQGNNLELYLVILVYHITKGSSGFSFSVHLTIDNGTRIPQSLVRDELMLNPTKRECAFMYLPTDRITC